MKKILLLTVTGLALFGAPKGYADRFARATGLAKASFTHNGAAPSDWGTYLTSPEYTSLRAKSGNAEVVQLRIEAGYAKYMSRTQGHHIAHAVDYAGHAHAKDTTTEVLDAHPKEFAEGVKASFDTNATHWEKAAKEADFKDPLVHGVVQRDDTAKAATTKILNHKHAKFVEGVRAANKAQWQAATGEATFEGSMAEGVVQRNDTAKAAAAAIIKHKAQQAGEAVDASDAANLKTLVKQGDAAKNLTHAAVIEKPDEVAKGVKAVVIDVHSHAKAKTAFAKMASYNTVAGSMAYAAAQNKDGFYEGIRALVRDAAEHAKAKAAFDKLTHSRSVCGSMAQALADSNKSIKVNLTDSQLVTFKNKIVNT